MYQSNRISSAKGFTLIELMISITILAILLALAVPAYKDYSIRSKIVECINGAAVAKVAISEYRQSLGPWPPSMEEAGLENSGSSHYCTAFIDYQDASGQFTIDLNEGAIDPLLGEIAPYMIPTEATSQVINWECTRGTTPPENTKYLPSTCRGS
jgi:type IV pilus assembly protein PilA